LALYKEKQRLTMNKKSKVVKEKFENILGESLRFHGLVTTSQGEDSNSKSDTELPAHLKTADFLFKASSKGENESMPFLQVAAAKNRKRNKK
jgi:hypothetical protein